MIKVFSRASLFCLAAGLLAAPARAERLLGTAFDADDAFLLAQESMDDLFESTEPAAEKPTPAAPVAPPAAATPAPAAVTPTPPADTTQSEPGSMDELFEAAPATAAEPTPIAKPPTPETAPALPEMAPPAVAVTKQPPAVKVTGFVQNELGYAYANAAHFSKFKTLSKVRISGRFNDKVSWQLGGHLQYDPVFQFENHYSDRVEDDQQVDGYVDETFIDIDAGAWDIRLGRQHIVWGEMVGLFFADVVSPLDLREFVLPDFDLMRIPQWAARAEYFADDFHGEVIYIPHMTIDDLGVPGSEFFPFPIKLPVGVQSVFRRDKTPDNIQDFGLGGRASWLKNGWDYSFFYYTSPDKTAAFQRQIDFGLMPTVTFTPTHERIHQFGSTVAKDFGSFVLKAEAIETTDRNISVTDLVDADGLAKSNELRYVVGIDWAGETGHNANIQLFQTWLQDHQPTMIFKEVETGVSLFLTTTSWHRDVKPEILWIRSLDRNEWLLETKVTWNFTPDWRAVLGSDIFEGPATGVLGQFDSSDRVYWELRYSF